MPCPRNGASPYPADNIDLVSVALFGAPDRQPAAMLAAEFLGHERGDVSRYLLERTASGKWLVPSFRRIVDWNETSGYGCAAPHRCYRRRLAITDSEDLVPLPQQTMPAPLSLHTELGRRFRFLKGTARERRPLSCLRRG
jgi:hypothetical protein